MFSKCDVGAQEEKVSISNSGHRTYLFHDTCDQIQYTVAEIIEGEQRFYIHL